MTLRSPFERIGLLDHLNFVLTNRIPRRAATRFMGWFAAIEQPLIRDASIAAFRLFCAPELAEAKKSRFSSLRDCFIRELADGRRPVDPRPGIVVSPCDGIVGACGAIRDGMMLQVKGSPYGLDELVRDPDVLALHRNGSFVTLRLTAGMYHRFHAPHDCRVVGLAHIAGDTWNVNPPTLARIPRLYCRNERVILRIRLDRGGHPLTLVPVAAVLVAGIRLHFARLPVERSHPEPWTSACDAAFAKGDQLGWFEHGSTIIVLTPPGFRLCGPIRAGHGIRMGEPLLEAPVPIAS